MELVAMAALFRTEELVSVNDVLGRKSILVTNRFLGGEESRE